jgi:YVTN family beta-propeller protein
MNRSTACATVGLVFVLGACAHLSQASGHADSYAIGARYALAGTGGWDLLAVDSGRHHLFLSRGDRVDVVDTRDGKLVATIAGIEGAHGIAIAPVLQRGFASNGKSDSVTEFDLDSLRRVRDLKVSGHSPDAILFDPYTHRVFVFNAKSNNASVIDAANGREIAIIPFAGNPELGVNDGKGHVFANIEDKAELVEIDAVGMKTMRTWPLPGCEGPTGLAMDVAHKRLFSACHNKIMAITDAESGQQVARIAIDDGPDGAAFDPQRQLVFSPNGKSGTLTIVHEDDPDHFRVIQTLVTQPSARTIAFDPETHRLYLLAARFEPQPAGTNGRPPMVPGSFSVLEVDTVR